jgi:hypothetical protein
MNAGSGRLVYELHRAMENMRSDSSDQVGTWDVVVQLEMPPRQAGSPSSELHRGHNNWQEQVIKNLEIDYDDSERIIKMLTDG